MNYLESSKIFFILLISLLGCNSKLIDPDRVVLDQNKEAAQVILAASFHLLLKILQLSVYSTATKIRYKRSFVPK